MNNTIAANGLTLLKLRSKLEPDPCPFDIVREQLEQTVSKYITPPSFAVAYLDHAVLIGRYAQGNFLFYDDDLFAPQYLQRLRVFNLDEELLIWRSGAGFKGRLRRDPVQANDGQEVEVVEAQQVLFGTRSTPLENDDFTEIAEERGARIILPFKGLQVDNKQQRIRIRTRNYIGYLKTTGQATYVDCRFVSFTDGQRDLA